MNIREFHLVDGHARIGAVDVALSRAEVAALSRQDARSVLLGFRPESVELVGPGAGFPVTVRLVEELGADAYLYGAIEGTPESGEPDLVARIDPAAPPRVGETVHVRVKAGKEHAFSPKTGLRLT
jgi:multiple sugar transport system ATP-binding protein